MHVGCVDLISWSDVEVETFLFGWFATQCSDDETLAHWSACIVDAVRESGKLRSCDYHRVMVIGFHVFEFPTDVFLDSLKCASAFSGGTRRVDSGVEDSVCEQVPDLFGDPRPDWTVSGASTENRTANGEVEFLANVANCHRRSSDERDLG